MHIKASTRDGRDQHHTLIIHYMRRNITKVTDCRPLLHWPQQFPWLLSEKQKKKKKGWAHLHLSRRRSNVTSLAERSPFGNEQDCCGKLTADCTRRRGRGGGIDVKGTTPKIDQRNNQLSPCICINNRVNVIHPDLWCMTLICPFTLTE